jgi:hypothetical protein
VTFLPQLPAPTDEHGQLELQLHQPGRATENGLRVHDRRSGRKVATRPTALSQVA